MLTELVGTVTFVNGHTESFVAPLTEEIDETGCRVYEARLPLVLDEDGKALRMRTATVEVLPAKSVIRFALDIGEEELND